MSSTFVQVAGGVGRKFLIGTTLSLIGLIIGFGCVLLPPMIPLALVGVAGVLLLWVLPELMYVPDRWTRRMVPIYIFIYITVPAYFAIILPGIPWISIRDVAQFLWLIPLAILIAGSSEARRRIVVVLRSSPWLSASALCFIAISVLTLITAVSLTNSLHYVINSFILWFIPMFGIVVCVRGKEDIQSFFKAAILAAGVDFVLGAIEEVLKRPYLIYILPPSMRAQIAAANPIAAQLMYTGWGVRQGLYRASASFGTSLSWGEVCAMISPFALHYFFHGKTSPQRVLGILGTSLCALSIVFSGARGAYVAMIVAIACYCVAWAFRTGLVNKGGLAGHIALALCSMACVATVLIVLFVPAVHNRVLGGGAEAQSTESRSIQWALAKPKIEARPILGHGGGSAGEVIHYISAGGAYSVDGYFMNLLVDYGVPGFLLFFATFLLCAATGLEGYIKSKDDVGIFGNALASSILAFTVYRITLSQNDSLPLAFMILGLTLTYSHLNSRQSVASAESIGDRYVGPGSTTRRRQLASRL